MPDDAAEFLCSRANPLAGEPDEAHDLVARYRNLDDPARAGELEGRLSGHSRFGSDLDGGTADAAGLEQPTFPPRDRDEEHGELPELPDPRLLRGVVATRAGSGLPRAEVLLFRAEAEDEEHRASVGRRAVPGPPAALPPGGRHAPGRDAVEHPVVVILTTAKPGSMCAPEGIRS